MAENPPIPERVDSLGISQQSKQSTDELISCQPDNVSDDSPSNSQPNVMEFLSPNFFQDMYKTLQDFQETGELCDIEIQCGRKTFKCHRLILASISGYFRVMFVGKMAESKQSVVKIQDIDENVLEKMIKYAYSGKITITVDNVQSVLYVASILQIENVANACSNFMKEHLHPDNCVQVHTFAMQHNRQQLIKYTQDFITDNFLAVSKTPEFMSMSAGDIDNILSSDKLNVSSEVEVFEAVMEWINHDKENRKQYLSKLVSKIKLPLINPRYLMEKVASNQLVRNDLECRDYLDEAKYYQMYIGNLVSDFKITERTRPRSSYAGKYGLGI